MLAFEQPPTEITFEIEKLQSIKVKFIYGNNNVSIETILLTFVRYHKKFSRNFHQTTSSRKTNYSFRKLQKKNS